MTMLPDPQTLPNGNAADLATFRAELVAELRAAVEQTAPIPFGRFRDEFLALYVEPLHKRATFIKMRQVLTIVAELAGPNATTADLTTTLVVRFIESRPPTQSKATIRGLVWYLRTVCNYAADQHYVRASPFNGKRFKIRGASIPNRDKVRHHSIQDIGRVLALARQDIARKVPGSWAQWRARRTHALITTLAYTGMRAAEAQRLRVEDIIFPDRMILIESRVGSELKTEGSAAPVPMTEHLAAVLAEWIPYLALPPNADPNADPGWLFPNCKRTAPWTGGSASGRPLGRCKRLGERLGIPGFTLLSLRHSLATHMESAWGMSDAFIQRMLRHTNPLTQKRYRHADMVNLRAGIQAVRFGIEDETTPAAPPAEPSRSIEFPDPAEPTTPRRGSLDPKNPSKPGVFHHPKLDPADVAEARELRARGWTYARLRARYRVSKSTLSALFNGLTHRHVPPAEGE